MTTGHSAHQRATTPAPAVAATRSRGHLSATLEERRQQRRDQRRGRRDVRRQERQFRQIISDAVELNPAATAELQAIWRHSQD